MVPRITRIILLAVALVLLTLVLGAIAAPVRAGGFVAVPRVLPVAPEPPSPPKVATRDA